jgi:hypothetical protein
VRLFVRLDGRAVDRVGAGLRSLRRHRIAQ